jgi:hypothetical protein
MLQARLEVLGEGTDVFYDEVRLLEDLGIEALEDETPGLRGIEADEEGVINIAVTQGFNGSNLTLASKLSRDYRQGFSILHELLFLCFNGDTSPTLPEATALLR